MGNAHAGLKYSCENHYLMTEKKTRKPSRLEKILDEAIAMIDSWPKLDTWDGILTHGQRCEGLYPEFIFADELEKISNMNPCNQIVGFKKAVIGFHTVPKEHPDYPKICYLCHDCHEIWDWQLWDDKGVPARKW